MLRRISYGAPLVALAAACTSFGSSTDDPVAPDSGAAEGGTEGGAVAFTPGCADAAQWTFCADFESPDFTTGWSGHEAQDPALQRALHPPSGAALGFGVPAVPDGSPGKSDFLRYDVAGSPPAPIDFAFTLFAANMKPDDYVEIITFYAATGSGNYAAGIRYAAGAIEVFTDMPSSSNARLGTADGAFHVYAGRVEFNNGNIVVRRDADAPQVLPIRDPYPANKPFRVGAGMFFVGHGSPGGSIAIDDFHLRTH